MLARFAGAHPGAVRSPDRAVSAFTRVLLRAIAKSGNEDANCTAAPAFRWRSMRLQLPALQFAVVRPQNLHLLDFLHQGLVNIRQDSLSEGVFRLTIFPSARR